MNSFAAAVAFFAGLAVGSAIPPAHDHTMVFASACAGLVWWLFSIGDAHDARKRREAYEQGARDTARRLAPLLAHNQSKRDK